MFLVFYFFFFKQKTAYEMRISDWSSDVCSSDLTINGGILQIASDANLGNAAGGLTFGGGTLQTTANVETGRAVELTGSGTQLPGAGTTFGLTGAVSGARGLVKYGAGVLVLARTNSYAGGTAAPAAATVVTGHHESDYGRT